MVVDHTLPSLLCKLYMRESIHTPDVSYLRKEKQLQSYKCTISYTTDLITREFLINSIYTPLKFMLVSLQTSICHLGIWIWLWQDLCSGRQDDYYAQNSFPCCILILDITSVCIPTWWPQREKLHQTSKWYARIFAYWQTKCSDTRKLRTFWPKVVFSIYMFLI